MLADLITKQNWTYTDAAHIDISDDSKEIIEVDSPRIVEEKRQALITTINNQINPIVKSLNERVESLHNAGYHKWSAEVANLAYKIDSGHHDFVNEMIEGGS